jgi:acyl-coenzyme A thioesterase PaaI-like protein
MIEKKYEAVADYCVTCIEAIRRTGIKVLEMRKRYVKLLMPLEGNVNHIGMMYAGSLFVIGEITGGVIHGASFDVTKFVPIVKEVNIRYRRPAFTDVTLEVSMTEEEADRIQAETLKNGKADFPMELEIKDASGEVVSIVKGIWQLRPMPEGMESPFPKID